MNNIGCGRVLTPRQQIEHLSREAIFARAKAREHQDVFDRILAKRHIIDTVHVEKRPGWSDFSFQSFFLVFPSQLNYRKFS